MNYSNLFDYVDGRLVWKKKRGEEKETRRWNTRYAGKDAGCEYRPVKSVTNYVRVVISKEWKLAHRIVWEMHYGEIKEGLQIDHKNGDGCDNRIENLRLVSGSQNKKNVPIQSNNTSGVAGVSWDKKSSAWVGRVSVNGDREVVYRGGDIHGARSAVAEAQALAGYHPNHGRPRYASL